MSLSLDALTHTHSILNSNAASQVIGWITTHCQSKLSCKFNDMFRPHRAITTDDSRNLLHCIIILYSPWGLYVQQRLLFKPIWYLLNDSTVGVATGYGLDDRCSNPGIGKIFLFSTAFKPALGPTQPTIQRIPEALSPGIMWPGREADHPPPSSAEVKNGGAIPPVPHMSSWHSA
jgi:hypothetical protein